MSSNDPPSHFAPSRSDAASSLAPVTCMLTQLHSWIPCAFSPRTGQGRPSYMHVIPTKGAPLLSLFLKSVFCVLLVELYTAPTGYKSEKEDKRKGGELVDP